MTNSNVRHLPTLRRGNDGAVAAQGRKEFTTLGLLWERRRRHQATDSRNALISPIPSADGEIVEIARYRFVSGLRKRATIVARQKSERLDRQGKHVADTALGLNDPRRARVGLQLAPQAQDLHVDAAVENVFVDPSCLQQVLAA